MPYPHEAQKRMMQMQEGTSFQRWMPMVSQYERVDVVFDIYKKSSLKSEARGKRGHGIRRSETGTSKTPTNWRSFWCRFAKARDICCAHVRQIKCINWGGRGKGGSHWPQAESLWCCSTKPSCSYGACLSSGDHLGTSNCNQPRDRQSSQLGVDSYRRDVADMLDDYSTYSATSCQELTKCSCKKSCKRRCKCFRIGLSCTALCSCVCDHWRFL